MKTLVSTYKGFDIYFDSSNGIFEVEGGDWQKNSKSYAAVKKWVDDFIKDNQLFGEFELVRMPSERSYDDIKSCTVKGISVLGNFLCEDSKGGRFQICSKYDMQKWCFPEDLKISSYSQEKVDTIRKEISKLYKDIKEEEGKLPEDATSKLLRIKKEKQGLWKN